MTFTNRFNFYIKKMKAKLRKNGLDDKIEIDVNNFKNKIYKNNLFISKSTFSLNNYIKKMKTELRKNGLDDKIEIDVNIFKNKIYKNNLFISKSTFSLNKYFKLLKKNIQKILLRPEKDILTYDILDTEKSKKNKLITLQEKHHVMKYGEIWQEVLGNYKTGKLVSLS